MSLITILPGSNVVIVDGRGLPVDCSQVDPNIHAVQFDTELSHGHIEFFNSPTADFRLNGVLEDIDEFQYLVDAWEVAKSEEDNKVTKTDFSLETFDYGKSIADFFDTSKGAL